MRFKTDSKGVHAVLFPQPVNGSPLSTIRVFSENATNRFWLNKGEEIFAFVSTEVFDAPIGKQFTLDTCGNFRSYPKATVVEAAVLKAAKRPLR